jgi:hypothetical protein
MPFNDGISNFVAPVTEVYLLVLNKGARYQWFICWEVCGTNSELPILK